MVLQSGIVCCERWCGLEYRTTILAHHTTYFYHQITWRDVECFAMADVECCAMADVGCCAMADVGRCALFTMQGAGEMGGERESTSACETKRGAERERDEGEVRVCVAE